MESEGKIWVERFNNAYNEQAPWRELWADCRRYMMPSETMGDELTESSRDGRRKAYPTDPTAADLCDKMANGLHSATVSYGDRWFTLVSESGGIADNQWCSDATRACIREMQEGNYLAVMNDLFHYVCCFGTGLLYVEDADGAPKFRNIPVPNTACIESDAFGEAAVVYVRYFYTAMQAVRLFGKDAVSNEVRRAWEDELRTGRSSRKFEFIHVTYRKEDFGEEWRRPVEEDEFGNGRMENMKEIHRPYGGVTVEKNTGVIVRRAGFFEFPYVVAKFMMSNDEAYGRSVGMLAMSGIKTLNEATALYLDGSKMAIRPPIGVPTNLPKLDLRPGAVTKVNLASPGQIWTYTTNANIPIGDRMMERLVATLKSMFKEDFFMAITKNGEMSATEVSERVEQAKNFISPIAMNMQHYVFRPLVFRVLSILERAGKVRKRPNGRLRVSFVSRLDSMIRQSEANRNLTFMQQAATIGQMKAANTDLGNVVDFDKLYDALAEAMGIDANLLYTEVQRAENREAEARAAEEQMRMQMEMEQLKRTDMNKKPDGGSVMDAWMNGRRS